jgi:hemerythrin-like domain-containing protein
MQARGPLMKEHRLIERMIAVIRGEMARVEKTRRIDPAFVDAAVDFIRVYADRTHHGKEEDILFKALAGMNLPEADRRVMNELVEEHVFGRSTTRSLVEANARHRRGDAAAPGDVLSCLRTLVDFYPRHIEKEDKVFFPACQKLLSGAEDRALLEAFREFDRKMIHEKYASVVESLHAALVDPGA